MSRSIEEARAQLDRIAGCCDCGPTDIVRALLAELEELRAKTPTAHGAGPFGAVTDPLGESERARFARNDRIAAIGEAHLERNYANGTPLATPSPTGPIVRVIRVGTNEGGEPS